MKTFYCYLSRFSRNQRILLGIASFAIFGLFFYVFRGEREDKREFSIAGSNSFIEGIRIVNKKDGKDIWVMTAKRADLTKDETIARMNSVAMDIKKDGIVLSADSGVYNMNTKDLRLEKNITIRGKDSTITAEDLSWNPSLGILSSNDKVRMAGSKFKIEGDGLSATTDKKLKLMRNVTATFF